jgi:UDP-N-acetylglucosamine 4,6-dehydratase
LNAILIIGGSGTLGHALVEKLYPQCRKIIVYSRTEAKQESMRERWPEYPDNRLRYILGDILDLDHLRVVTKGVDAVIHAAALKYIDRSEYNAIECFRVNCQGTVNVAKACAENNVPKAMFVSTDKACCPISNYGASKLLGERVWISSNNLSPVCKFNCCRYGNVYASNGSVFVKWQRLIDSGLPIQLTDSRMTRFFWEAEDAAGFLLEMLEKNERGSIYVPKMQSYNMLALAKKMNPIRIDFTGLRCSEKIHEDLISIHESPNTRDCGDYYTVYPFIHDWINNLPIEGQMLPDGFAMSSRDGALEDLP